MKFLVILTLVGLSSAQYIRQEKALEVPKDPATWRFQGNQTVTRGGRIMNGFTASNTQFPFVARMSINLQSGGLVCTGSLIAPNWIVSARHCIAE
jgi:Trypsin